MGEPFHNHFLKNLSGWWLMIESKNHWKVPSPLPPSFISLCLRREQEEMCSPWNFDELSFARDLQLVGARENVYKGWWGGNIQIFTFLAFEGEERYSSLPWRRNIRITTGNVSESEASCLTILVLVWEARRDKEKQSLATRNGSYNQQ